MKSTTQFLKIIGLMSIVLVVLLYANAFFSAYISLDPAKSVIIYFNRMGEANVELVLMIFTLVSTSFFSYKIFRLILKNKL